MKKNITVILLMIAPLMINVQHNKVSKSDMTENTFEIGILNADNSDSENKKHAIITNLINKNWNGVGLLMGKKATFTMNWQKVLGNQFIKLEFQNKRKSDTNKDIVFKATAFYKIINDTTVVGNWFDNRGVSLPLKGHVKENELTIFWGDSKTETGKTIYRYTSNSTIDTEDFIMNNGKYYKFGNATYKTKD